MKSLPYSLMMIPVHCNTSFSVKIVYCKESNGRHMEKQTHTWWHFKSRWIVSIKKKKKLMKLHCRNISMTSWKLCKINFLGIKCLTLGCQITERIIVMVMYGELDLKKHFPGVSTNSGNHYFKTYSPGQPVCY